MPNLKRTALFLFAATVAVVSGCGQTPGAGGGLDAGMVHDAAMAAPPDLTPPCTELRCRVVKDCMGDGTSLSGVVNIPAGRLPLYNATVYVPNSAVAPIVHGPSCDLCDDLVSGDPIVQGQTNVKGEFHLKNVPAGDNVPLVIRVGKWRRQVMIPHVTACMENKLDPELTRLPRNQKEGDLPRIALTTGSADAVECLLRKLGVDDSEFTPETGTGSVNLFNGHGGADGYDMKHNNGVKFTVASDSPTMTTGWWSDPKHWNAYDLVLLSCEGAPYPEEKSPVARMALQDYINKGGRVFASHWHNIWIGGGPAPLSTVGQFFDKASSKGFLTPINATIDQSTNKGKALAQWLLEAGGSLQLGEMQIMNAKNSVISIDPMLTQRFVYYDDPANMKRETQYFTFNAPVGAKPDMQCGRMVFTDLHVSGSNGIDPMFDRSLPSTPFPTGCVTELLSAQEKALIFLLFDLSNCLMTMIG